MRELIFELLTDAGVMWTMLFAGGISLVSVMVIINLCYNPYSRQNKIMLNNCTYLARKIRETVNLKGFSVPPDYETAFSRFKACGRSVFPSEIITFMPKSKKVLCLKGFAVIQLALAFAGIIYSDNYGAALAYITLIPALTVVAVAVIENSNAGDLKRARRMFNRWLSSLDSFFGNDYFVQIVGKDNIPGKNPHIVNPSYPPASDVRIERTIEQLKYLMSQGVNEVTAKEIVTLLNDPALNKRTVEQQRKLNDILSQILQMIADKKEEKILS